MTIFKREIKTKVSTYVILMLVAISAMVIDVYNGKTSDDISLLNRPTEAKNSPLEAISMREWVFTRLEQNLGTEEAINGMMIIQCESSWNPMAVSETLDLGLWQISAYYHQDISNEQKFSYTHATDWAINKYWADGNSWSAWVCAKILGIN